MARTIGFDELTAIDYGENWSNSHLRGRTFSSLLISSKNGSCCERWGN